MIRCSDTLQANRDQRSLEGTKVGTLDHDAIESHHGFIVMILSTIWCEKSATFRDHAFSSWLGNKFDVDAVWLSPDHHAASRLAVPTQLEFLRYRYHVQDADLGAGAGTIAYEAVDD
jgi:hypothetical protein